jgi:hypothetical protein
MSPCHEVVTEFDCMWREICPSATLSTTNPTWTGQVLNLGVYGEWLATNRLSHVTVLEMCQMMNLRNITE